jgi:transposase
MRSMRAYSTDLRQAVMRAYEQQGYSQPQVARIFGISAATVRNWVRRQRETGSVATLPHRGGARAKLDGRVRDRVRALVQDNTAVLLRELCEQVRREFRHRVSTATMCRVLQALGLPRKKERSTLASATRLASSRRGQSIVRG